MPDSLKDGAQVKPVITPSSHHVVVVSTGFGGLAVCHGLAGGRLSSATNAWSRTSGTHPSISPVGASYFGGCLRISQSARVRMASR